MNKYVKGAMIFVGGATVGLAVGGVTVGRKMLSDNDIRQVLVKKISDEIDKWLFGEPATYRSCRDSDRRNHDIVSDEEPDVRFDNVRFNTQIAAEGVLKVLQDKIGEKYYATVFDLYRAAGTLDDFANEEITIYGWRNIDNATIRNLDNNQYVIDLPKPEKLTK